jgi:ribosome-binding factor A
MCARTRAADTSTSLRAAPARAPPVAALPRAHAPLADMFPRVATAPARAFDPASPRETPNRASVRRAVTCMAHPRRVQKVQQQMRREISQMMQQDKNLRGMISPEERMGVDNILSVMATVAEVEVSNDLQVVKVYVSILGDDRGKKNAIKGLKRMETYVRSKIGRRMSLRLTPEIRFIYDDSFERGQRVGALLDEIRAENRSKTAKKYGKDVLQSIEDVIAERGDVEDDGDEDWDGDVEGVWDEMIADLGDEDDDDDDFDDDEELDGDDDDAGIKIINV